tara:strand:+ start:51 stop:548 length:498 start_codon:yes stop_codon:yes gene_type:complete
MAKKIKQSKKKAKKKVVKKVAKKVATKAATRVALGAVPIVGPAAVALSVIASQMKPGSALSNFLNKSKNKNLGKSMQSGPKQRRKLKPKDVPAMSPGPKKRRKIGDQKAAERREAARGKVGPKRNVVKDKKGGVVRGQKSGKAVTFGGKSAFQKRMEERKAGGGR